jgi:hypothetical protein
MVSFSKYNIKTINKKNITYGKFGIGLKNNWVVRKKLHPVLYLDKNSHVANALSKLLEARRKKANVELTRDVKLSIMTIKCFTKNSVGYNSYFKSANFNFKSENEWRYIPSKSEIGNNHISKTKKIYEINPDFYNEKLKEFPLKFKISDIECIFVETEKQRKEISVLLGIDKAIIKISNWKSEMKKARR